MENATKIRIGAVIFITLGAISLFYFSIWGGRQDINAVLTPRTRSSIASNQRAQSQGSNQPNQSSGGYNLQTSEEAASNLLGTRAESIEEAQKFVVLMATMAGSVAQCSPVEKKLITDCGQNILENWTKYSNRPSIEGDDIKKNLENLWTKSAEDGIKYSAQQGFSCGDLLSKSKDAPIWQFCPRPDVVPMTPGQDSIRIQ